MNCSLILLIASLFAAAPQIAVGKTLIDKTDSPECAQWVDSVYDTLSERERIAQLMMPNITPAQGAQSEATIRRLVEGQQVGGILFSEGSLAEYAHMISYAQKLAKVPLLISFDGEWGLSMRIPQTPRFPKNMGLGAIADPDLLYTYGREMARECKALGVHVNFAPVLDVNSNPANPVIGYRSFGEDQQRVSALGLAYSRGLEDGGVQAVAKHFPGHGDTDSDSHKTLPVVNHSAEMLEAVDLLPFRQFIKAGRSGIMVGHLSVPALDPSMIPASLSQKISTDYLRGKLGFKGLIYTDALAMRGADTKGNNCVAALKAGADVLLSSSKPADDIEAIMQAVRSGKLPEQLIEERCKRVLAYKYVLDAGAAPGLSIDQLSRVINSPEAEAVNNRLAAASITVLKNEDNMLPIGELAHNSIAVVNIGAPADNTFSSYCRRYADCDVYSTQSDGFSSPILQKILAHKTVIAAVYDKEAASQTALSQLRRAADLVAVFMVNPYQMAKFKSSLQSAKAVVLAYDDTEYTQKYAAQALFGGIAVSGRLPVNLNGVATIGAGISLPKTRLGYFSPSNKGMNPALADSIDSIINKAMRSGAFPGCQVLVAHKGDVVIDRAYGLTTAKGDKVDFSTVYDLASVSKTVGTLPGVMKAYDLGMFSLDAPASDHIPGLKADAAKTSITPRMLLHHETGMPPSLNMYNLMIDPASYSGKLLSNRLDKSHTIKISDNVYGAKSGRLRRDITSAKPTRDLPIKAAEGLYTGEATFDTIMQHIYDAPVRLDRKYRYSCLNFCLLMDLEQRLTGQPHQQWVSDSIWAPIGAYGFCYRPTEKYPLSKIAATENDTYLRKQHVRGYVHDELAAFSGGVQGNAGVFGTANDIAKLCQMWLNGGEYGGQRVLSEGTTHLFTTEKSPTCRRGLGFDKPDTLNPDNSPTCDEAGASVFGHTGFTGTVYWVDPSNDLIFIFLCNRVDPTRSNAAYSRAHINSSLFRQVYKALD